MHVDFLTATGPGRLAQVEFVTHIPKDLGHRLLEYRVRIMGRHPGHSLQQYVLVLGRGDLDGEIRDLDELRMRVHVRYARDSDPADLLENPSLAPLAVLGRADSESERARVLRSAFRVINTIPDLDLRHRLTETATVLATIRLDRATIDTIWKECDMPIDVHDTDFAQSFIAEGRAEGRAEGTIVLAAAILQRQFGDDERIPGLAERLSQYSSDVLADAVLSAKSVEDLEAALSSGLAA